MEDESQLVRRRQQGELGAFNQLVERYQGQVCNLALRWVEAVLGLVVVALVVVAAVQWRTARRIKAG
jgi:hypothetical protein